MILMDVNVLVYAHREDVRDHAAYREWLESLINSNTAYGFSELVLSGFIRIVTHPKVFEQPVLWRRRWFLPNKYVYRNMRYVYHPAVVTGSCSCGASRIFRHREMMFRMRIMPRWHWSGIATGQRPIKDFAVSRACAFATPLSNGSPHAQETSIHCPGTARSCGATWA